MSTTSPTLDPHVRGAVTRLEIHHPRVSLLAALGHAWPQAVTGHWSIAARLCSWHGDRVLDLEGACMMLDAAADQSGLRFLDDADDLAPRVRIEAEDGLAILVGDRAIVMRSLDLFSRLLCGQWRVLVEEASRFPGRAAARSTAWEPETLVQIRNRYGRLAAPGGTRRLAANEWPSHPLANLGIAEGPLAAKVAYHAYKALGGGTSGGPTFVLPDGPLYVIEDGVRRPVPGMMGRLL